MAALSLVTAFVHSPLPYLKRLGLHSVVFDETTGDRRDDARPTLALLQRLTAAQVTAPLRCTAWLR